MNDTPNPQPWHKRSILPRWFPGWLLACLLSGVAIAAAVGFLLNDWQWRALAIGFALGFAILLVLQSLVRPRKEDVGSTIIPPAWVRIPVVATVVVALCYFWAEKQLRGPAPAGLEASAAAWILLLGLSWFGFRLLRMGWDVLRAVRAGGQHFGCIPVLSLLVSALAGGAVASAALIVLWPDVFRGWTQALAWAAALPGLLIGAVIDMYLALRTTSVVAWLLALRLPYYRALLQSPDPAQRTAAARSIMYMHRRAAPAMPDLVTTLNDHVADVRAAAALAIHFSNQHDPSLPAALRPRLSDPDPRVRVAAVATMLRLKSFATAEAVPILAAGLVQPDEQYSNLAGWQLAELGADAAPALPALRAAVFERQPPNESALQALSKLGEPGVLILAEALSHVEPWVRRSAAHCLGVLGSTAQSAVPALEAASADPDRTVRKAVTDALIRMGYSGKGT
jgi:HEAT repeat protein